MRGLAERAVELFDEHVRKPIRDTAGDDERAAEQLVEAFRELLPAVTTLVSHHFRRVLLETAEDHIEWAATPRRAGESALERRATVPLPQGEEKARAVRAAVRHDLAALRPREPRDDVRDGRGLAPPRGARAAAAGRLARRRPRLRDRRPLPRAASAPGYRAVGFDFSHGMLVNARDRGAARRGRRRCGCRSRDARGRRRHVRVRAAQRRLARRVLRGAGARRAARRPHRAARRERARQPRAARRPRRVLQPRRAGRSAGSLSDRDAYSYLPRSMAYLPGPAEMVSMLREAGFPDAAPASALGRRHAAARGHRGRERRDAVRATRARRGVRPARRLPSRRRGSSSSARASGWPRACCREARRSVRRVPISRRVGRCDCRRRCVDRRDGRRRAPWRSARCRSARQRRATVAIPAGSSARGDGRRDVAARRDRRRGVGSRRRSGPSAWRATCRTRRSRALQLAPCGPQPRCMRRPSRSATGTHRGAASSTRSCSRGRSRCERRRATLRLRMLPGARRPPRRSIPTPTRSSARRRRTAVLVGASPELLRLAPRRARSGRTRSPAPRRARAIPTRIVANADALADSAKDREEHAIVVAAVAAALGAVLRRARIRRRARAASDGQRLAPVHAVRRRAARPGAVSALELVAALHPTPAVGGSPRAAALDGDRGARAVRSRRVRGAGGLGRRRAATASGRSRCGARSSTGDRATLFAGAGIVAGSDPAREVDETERKFRAFLDALRWG